MSSDGVVHYCVTNMPGAVARTSTYALTNATLPFVLALAGKGWRQAMLDDPHLAEGLNIHDGQVTHIAVAQALGLRHTPVRDVLVRDVPVRDVPVPGAVTVCAAANARSDCE